MPLRWIGWIVALAVIGIVGSASGGRLGGTFGAVLGLGLFVWTHVVMPRAAHRRFRAAAPAAARWRYQWLARVALTRRGARRAQLSVIACDLAAGAYAAAAAALGTLDVADLDTDGRAVVLGNRAYAALRAGATGAAAHEARQWAEEACQLRPDVAALGHTRALALARTGDDRAAIALLDSLWADGSLPPLLEAERCWELAEAWRRRGEHAYGDDYRARARVALAALGEARPPWIT